MSRIFLVAVCALLFNLFKVYAQETKTVHLKPGDDINDPSIIKQLYKYPRFTYGKVYFNNGDSSAGNLNYNFLKGVVEFISPGGDTLSLANEEDLRLISIQADTFFYDQGYLQQRASFSKGKLAVKQQLKVRDNQKIGAFGIPSSSGNIESRDAYRNFDTYKLKVNEELILSLQTLYYISNQENRFLPVNKKNLFKLFPRQKKQIEDYLSANNINMTREEDLKKLLSHLN